MKKSTSFNRAPQDALYRGDLAYRAESATYQLHPTSKADPNVKRLLQALTAWINSYVMRDAMTVRDLFVDLHDGQILSSFLQQTTGDEIVPPDMMGANSERSKTAIMSCVARYVESNLGISQDPERWTVEGIVGQDVSSILCLLVDLAQVMICPYTIPPALSVAVITRQDLNGTVKNKTTVHKITPETIKTGVSPKISKRHISAVEASPLGEAEDAKQELDAFDRLFANKDRMQKVTALLLEFINSQLEGMNISIHSLSKVEGVHLILLLGSLGNFFVPMTKYDLAPANMAAKLENVRFALSIMADTDIDIKRVRPTDLIKKDVKAISRCLYAIFQAFNQKEHAPAQPPPLSTLPPLAPLPNMPPQ